MGRKHAKLGPSGAHRWSVCLGSPNAEEGLADMPSFASKEGTFAHDIRERCLRKDKNAADYIGFKAEIIGEKFEVDDVMAAHLQRGIDRIRRTAKGHWFVEQAVRFERWVKGGFGTMDFGAASRKLIVIDDLKYGAGVVVKAEGSLQLGLYALGFWDTIGAAYTDTKDFLLRIDQPRAPGGGGEWETNLKELKEIGAHLKVRAQLTEDPDAPRTPGVDQCRFCKAAAHGTCAEYEQFNMRMLTADLENLDADDEDAELVLEDPQRMSPKKRSFIIKHTPMITKWLRDLHDAAMRDADLGLPVPGMKRVKGRKGPRKWTDEERAEKLLIKLVVQLDDVSLDDLYTKKLRSPTQVETVLGKEIYARLRKKNLITQNDGRIALVEDTDKRPALKSVTALLPNLEKNYGKKRS